MKKTDEILFTECSVLIEVDHLPVQYIAHLA